MDARKGNIYEILNGNKQFLIPVYQRFYSWDIAQCQRLWNDIVTMQKEGKQGHFVGSIVNIAEQAMPTGVQKYMIIDGQQRMTTLSLLLLALRDYGLEHPEDQTINPRRIDNMLLKNEYETGDERFKLLLTESDREVLIALIERKPLQGHVNSRIRNNYNFFAKQIESQQLSPAEIYESIGKLQIVNITLDRQMDDAQAIFESLNSTGKELTESDLIRNYVLMGLDAGEQTYVYEHLWRPMELLFEYDKQEFVMDRFFRDYLTMKQTRIPKVDCVYEEFKKYHLNCEFSLVRDLCDDLYKFARYYTDMVFARSEDDKLRALYQDINSLKMEVSYPFLLKVHNDYSLGIISMDTLIEIINICISYVVRRNICDIPTNSLNKTFATLKNEIKTEDYLNSIKAFFVLRDDYKIFPTDERFSAVFASRDIYNMRARNYILRHLEMYNNKGNVVVENYTIEHIMPQNQNLSADWTRMLGDNWKDVQKNYLHTIGNLTLTAYNSEMSDRPFNEKMDMEGGFKQSALKLNSYLVMQNEWNEEKIKERGKILTDIALKIWAYPQLTESELAPYLVKNEHEERYSIESYNTNAYTQELFDVLDKRIRNLSPGVKREFKKLYVAYKLDTNFTDIVFQEKRLRVSINMKFADIVDKYGICMDITGVGRWGNGDAELFFENIDDIEKVMDIITQSFNWHLD